MTTKKANIIKIIVCVILASIMLVGNIVMSYAVEPDAPSTDNPDTIWYEWNDEELAEFWQSLMPGYILSHLGVVGSEEFLNSCYDNFVDIVDGLSIEAEISYNEWIGAHFYLNPKENVNPEIQKPSDLTVNNYTLDSTMVEVVNQAVQESVAENPLGYVMASLYSYKMMSTTPFDDYAKYETVQTFLSRFTDGYFLIMSNGFNGTDSFGGQSVQIVCVHIPSSYNFGLYGDIVDGVFSNVHGIYNWQTSINSSNWESIDYFGFKGNGQVVELNKSSLNQVLHNSIAIKKGFGSGSNQGMTLYTCNDKRENVLIFSTVAAYKNYNAGIPQDYYYGSGGINYPSTSVTSSNLNSGNVQDAYNQITDNSVSGMTGEEVIKLVDTVLKYYSTGSGGSGSGGNGHIIDFSSVSDLIASIGALIGELISGLAEGLTNIVSAIRSVITTIRENLTHGIIFEWLTELIAWLPTEIRSLIIALFTLTVIFACIKLVKGIL